MCPDVWHDAVANMRKHSFQRMRLIIPCILPVLSNWGSSYQSRHYRRYIRWLDLVLANTEFVSVELETTNLYAQIRFESKFNGNPILSNDTRIAAVSKQNDSPILSNDLHFYRVSGIHCIAKSQFK